MYTTCEQYKGSVRKALQKRQDRRKKLPSALRSLAPSSEECMPEQSYAPNRNKHLVFETCGVQTVSSRTCPCRLPPLRYPEGGPLPKAEGRAQGTLSIFRDLVTHFQSPSISAPPPAPANSNFQSPHMCVSMCLRFIYTTHVCC